MFGGAKKNLDVYVGECLIDRDAAAADVSKSNVQMQITILGKKYILHPTEVGCNGRIHRLTFNDAVSVDTGGRKSSVILFALTVRSASAGRVKLCHTSCEGHYGEDQLKKLLFFNDTASGLRCGNVTIMMYAGRSPSNQTTASIKGDLSLRNADKEYQFLRNRRLHWPNSRSSTFDQQMEGHLDADPAVSQKELESMQKGHEMTPIKKSTKSAEIKRRRKFIVKLKRDIDKEAKKQEAFGGTEGILTRRTAMGVGFVGAGWPETPDPKKKIKISDIGSVLGPSVIEDPEKVEKALNEYKRTMQRIQSAESYRRKFRNDIARNVKKKIQNNMNKNKETRLALVEKEELMRDQYKVEIQKKKLEAQKRKEEEQKKRKAAIAATSDEARRIARLGLQQNNDSTPLTSTNSTIKHSFEKATSGNILASPAQTEENAKLRKESIRERTLAAEAFIKGGQIDFDIDMDDDDKALAQSVRSRSAPPRRGASPLRHSVNGNFTNKGAKFGPSNPPTVDDVKMRPTVMRAVGDDSYNPKPPLPPDARGRTPIKSRREAHTDIQNKGNKVEPPNIYGHKPTRTRAPILPPEELPHFADPVIKGAYSMALQFTRREVQQLQDQRLRAAGSSSSTNIRPPTTKKLHLHVPSSTTKSTKVNKMKSEPSIANIPFSNRTKKTPTFTLKTKTVALSKATGKNTKSKSKSKRSVFDIDVEEEVDVDKEITKAKEMEKEDDDSFDIDGIDEENKEEPVVSATAAAEVTTKSTKSKSIPKTLLNKSKSTSLAVSTSNTFTSQTLEKTKSLTNSRSATAKSKTSTTTTATIKKDKTPSSSSKKSSSPAGKELKKTSPMKSKGKVINTIAGTGSNSKKLSKSKSLKTKAGSPARQLLLGSDYTTATGTTTNTISSSSGKFPPRFTTHTTNDSTKSPTRLAKSKSTKSPARNKSLKARSKSTSANDMIAADLTDLHLSGDEPDFGRPTRQSHKATRAPASSASGEEAALLAKLDSKIASLTAKAAALGASADRLDEELASDDDELGLGTAEEDRIGLDAYGAPSPKSSKENKEKTQIQFKEEGTDDLGLGLGLFSPPQKVSGAADANDWEKEIADALGDTSNARTSSRPNLVNRRPSRAGHQILEATDSDDEFDD